MSYSRLFLPVKALTDENLRKLMQLDIMDRYDVTPEEVKEHLSQQIKESFIIEPSTKRKMYSEVYYSEYKKTLNRFAYNPSKARDYLLKNMMITDDSGNPTGLVWVSKGKLPHSEQKEIANTLGLTPKDIGLED